MSCFHCQLSLPGYFVYVFLHHLFPQCVHNNYVCVWLRVAEATLTVVELTVVAVEAVYALGYVPWLRRFYSGVRISDFFTALVA